MLGRRAYLSDISVLGQHIGRNYVNLVNADMLSKHAEDVVRATRDRLPGVYAVPCASCGQEAELAKTVWSFLVACSGCGAHVDYYRSLEAAHWRRPDMQCPCCGTSVSSRNPRCGEEPVLDYITCSCASRQREQPANKQRADIPLDSFSYPQVEITSDRQMYHASALAKHRYTTVASFYSSRNLAVLSVLRDEIGKIADETIRSKLLFAFTGCLTRASKRYQWSRQRPLNAANANYYVAPVFYEWNVFELFERKVTAVVRADEWIRKTRRHYVGHSQLDAPDVHYELRSADASPLPDDSVDYAFTDPPFGSNHFYADMALFQEGWLGAFTDVDQEAVIDRRRDTGRSSERYEQLLIQALAELRRVVKPGGHISMVFGNSSGKVWALVQRAIYQAGLTVIPEALAVLDKGQRSVKGLASGFEDVATLDLVITMTASSGNVSELREITQDEVVRATRELAMSGQATSPSHLYLELLRQGLHEGWLLSGLDLRTVTETLLQDGWHIDTKSGRLLHGEREMSEPL